MTATWGDLLDRAEGYEVTLESIRRELADRRSEEGSNDDRPASTETGDESDGGGEDA